MTDDTYIDLENRLDFLLPEKRGYGGDMRKLLRCAISTRDWVLADAIERVVTELLQRMEAADRELQEFDAWVSECEVEDGNMCDGCQEWFYHPLTWWKGSTGQGAYCKSCLPAVRVSNALCEAEAQA